MALKNIRLFAGARGLLLLACAFVCSLMLAGCSKQAKTTAPAPPPVTADVAPAPAAAAEQPLSNPAPDATSALIGSDGQPDLAALNRTLMRWIMGNHRRPASFEDFAATANVAIPPPPAGKKYVIAKNMRIQLADR